MRSSSRAGEFLACLVAAEGFVSGTRISRSLGISRAALNKHAHALRARGYRIEALKGRGYRLAHVPDLAPEELLLKLKGGFVKDIHYRAEVDSTNDLAMRMAGSGAPGGTVVLADSQRSGRGRLGRKWQSPAGVNVYMSVVLRPKLPLVDITLLTLAGAVATARGIRDATGLEAGIKWPNDVMASGRKLGGILLQTRAEPDRIAFAVVGIGINVNMALTALPRSIRPLSTSVLKETGIKHRRTPIVAAVLNELGALLKGLRRNGRAPLLEAWRELSLTLGRRVSVRDGDRTITGTALDIDETGRLLVKTRGGKIVSISSGDLTQT